MSRIPFLTCLLLAITLTAFGQDKIYTNEGNTIEAKVISISPSKVLYKRFENQAGPEYNLPLRDVKKIVYQNGTVDDFNGRMNAPAKRSGRKGIKKTKEDHSLGNNIISFIPGAYTYALEGNLNDPGVGISYERMLEKNGHISVVLPLMYNFSSDRDFGNNLAYGGVAYTGSTDYHSVSFIPGVRFYPAPKKNRVRYGLGLSVFATFGSEPYSVYDDSYYIRSYSTPQQDWHYSMYGIMISNSLNASVTKHFFIGIDLNAGVPVSDNRRKDSYPAAVVFNPIMQFALKLGLRF